MTEPEPPAAPPFELSDAERLILLGRLLSAEPLTYSQLAEILEAHEYYVATLEAHLIRRLRHGMCGLFPAAYRQPVRWARVRGLPQ